MKVRNTALRAALVAALASGTSSVALATTGAEVIGTSAIPGFRAITIDKGTTAGLVAAMAVSTGHSAGCAGHAAGEDHQRQDAGDEE